MKKYTTPIIDMTVIKNVDVITTSSLITKNGTRSLLSPDDFEDMELDS